MIKKLGPLLAAYLLTALPVRAETKTVNFIFPVPVPNTITISVGDSIRFNGPSTTHPLRQVTNGTGDTPVSGGFESTLSPFTTQPFNTPGTYFYQCEAHGTNGGSMRGSITVEAGGGGSSTPTPEPTNEPGVTPQPTATVPAGCSGKPPAAILTSPATGAQIKNTRVSLDWQDEACATSYKVVVRSGKKKGPIVDQKTVKKSKYKTIKLGKGKTYFWSVKNCNAAGCGANSAASSFSIP